VGPAGVGKTRLATEAAARCGDPSGAWLVRLESVRSPAELPVALADAVPGIDAVDAAGSLRGADLLLVVDNCEHLAEPVAGLVSQVLDAAPGVRVLATSQRPLGLDGELVRAVPPLPESDAVALFVQRAFERRPAFALDAGTAVEVAQLCRALDCLPLAIELAAGRARILTVPEISQRLGDRFTLLADPTSGRPARRRTLAAALSWSYDLLFPDDQRDLWALAQFPGGATMPAVEHVLAALGVPAGAALDVVERLTDRSLAIAEPGASGATRYRLLDSVRAFAADRAADAGAAGRAADAVLDWVAGLADVVAAQVRGPGQAASVAVTADERATIDVALDHARRSRPETGLRIAVGFGWAWVLLDDGAAAARLRAARTAVDTASLELRVTALLLESWLEAMSGDLGRARTALDAAIALAGDDGPVAELTRWYGGLVLTQEGRAAEALAALARCRAAFAASGRPGTSEAVRSWRPTPTSHSATSEPVVPRARRRSPSSDPWTTPGGCSMRRPRSAGSRRPNSASPTLPATTGPRPRRPTGWGSSGRPPCTCPISAERSTAAATPRRRAPCAGPSPEPSRRGTSGCSPGAAWRWPRCWREPGTARRHGAS
jgi:predicted ATPase